jgi:hypothetical protein
MEMLKFNKIEYMHIKGCTVAIIYNNKPLKYEYLNSDNRIKAFSYFSEIIGENITIL